MLLLDELPLEALLLLCTGPPPRPVLVLESSPPMPPAPELEPAVVRVGEQAIRDANTADRMIALLRFDFI